MPCFTVIMPCRNGAKTLPETLASLMAQSFRDWNAVIVDDGSTDATPELLVEAACRDPRISVLRTDGVGPSSARNFAASRATGRWFAFLDADDVWPAERLADLFNAIERDPMAGAFYGRCAFFSDDASAPNAHSSPKTGALTIGDVLGENPTCTMSNLTVRSDRWRRIGGLDPEMVHAEDLDLLIRLIWSGARIEGLAKTLTCYRANPAGLSADLEAMESGWRACLARARSLGVASEEDAARAEAKQLRYLARRALRIGGANLAAARYALRGAQVSPAGFFGDIRRGGATFAAALTAPITPKSVARVLYAR